MSIDRRGLHFFLTWEGEENTIAQGQCWSAITTQRSSDGLLQAPNCDCKLPTKCHPDAVHPDILIYSCAENQCDFISLDDGVDLNSIAASAVDFDPGTIVSFQRLPPQYSYTDGSDPSKDGQGEVVDVAFVQEMVF